MSLLVHVCDDCGGQYAPEVYGEVCGCLDREGARHLTEIEVVPLNEHKRLHGLAEWLVSLDGNEAERRTIDLQYIIESARDALAASAE